MQVIYHVTGNVGAAVNPNFNSADIYFEILFMEEEKDESIPVTQLYSSVRI